MEITQEHIDQIKSNFGKIQSKQDLLELMNMAKKLVYGDNSIPFKLQQITYYSSPKISKKRYSSFTIKKKSGNDRTINAPVKGLKAIQRVLGFILQCVFEPHPAAFGFVRNKSIVDNASIHVGSRYVYNIDLKDFFSSIDQARVWKCLQLQPFNLNKESNSAREELIPSDTFSYSPEIRIIHKLWLKNGQKIFWFEFKGLNLKRGQNNLSLKKGGNIFYEVLNYSDEQSGKIYVIIDKSDLESLKSLAKENSTNNSEDYDLTFMSYLFQLTTTHSKKLFEKDTRSNLSNILASLCCTEMDVERLNEAGEWESVKRNVLPQGAPTSPVITNIICQRLDYLLTGVAKRFGLKYSRYADDITFSSMHNVYQAESEFSKELHRIIAEQNFHIKESKTRLQKDGYRKEVTGLLVNEKANVQKRYVKQLRMWLYYWERYGYDRAYSYFLSQYIFDKGHVKKGKPDMANVISGKLDYLKMVKGGDNELYLKLKSRFDLLTIINKTADKKTSSISSEIIFSNFDFEIPYIANEDSHQKNTNKLRINIDLMNSTKQQNKLKKDIIIRKGENLPHVEVIENNEIEEKEIDLSKHKPIEVSKFLKYFQTGKMKWLTHKFEEGPYNRTALIQEAKDEFVSLTRSLAIQPALYRRVNWFGFIINQEKFYYLNKYHYTNWQSANVLKWELENPNMHPINSDLLFAEMFEPFKKSIELKNKELKNLISDQLVSSLGGLYTSFDFEYNDLDNVNFYTDVDALKRGLSYLFNAIKQRSENSRKVKFKYRKVSDNEGRKRIIEITHINSASNKSLEKIELFKGDLLAAEKAFFGICDWSIISKSTDKTFNKLNVLFDINSNKIPKEKIEDSLIEGFTHILTFYA